MTRLPLQPRLATLATLAAAVLLASAAGALGSPLGAQAEVVRGRVVSDSSVAIAGAAVVVTRGPDRMVLHDTTDAEGNYSVRYDEGTGDYLVYVSATGYRAARRRVQREEGRRAGELVADFVLARDLSMLEAVNVRANRPVRASNAVRPTDPETGASERWRDGVEGAVPPSVAGDLAATALTMPGVTLTPSGPAMLGAASESNLMTLNGMGLAASAIPRAARTETRVTGATFDPTRGGFAGANVDVRLGPGDRFYQRRNAFVTFDPPALQLTDAIGRASGVQSGGVRGSVGADGELIRRALTYNVALDAAYAASSPATLTGATEETLLRAGISPDSVERVLSVATPLGLVGGSARFPTQRERNALTWLGRLDDTRDSLHVRTFTSYAGITREGALGYGALVAPAAGGERNERTLGAQLVFTDFVGPGQRTLTETRFAASRVDADVAPYLALPGAAVLVRSPNAEAQQDVTRLQLGGNPSLASDESRWTAEGANETIWNGNGRTHRFKALLWGRVDGSELRGLSNPGTFSFASIDDLAAGRASSYSRTLEQPDRAGTSWNTAAALAHQWVRSRWFSMLYGARLEASGYGSAPARNPQLESALGVRTGLAPTRVHVSPRAGFSFMYNRDRENGSGTNQNPVGRFYRTSTGVIRGGIGEFRDLARPGLVADASASTGLPGATSVLSCVGAAVPAVDWDAFADPASLPTQCADGGGVLAERAPSVTLIGEDYDVPRSWRASLDWSTNIRKLLFRASVLGSYDLSQPGVVDANFRGEQRFSLAEEGGRPVFVSPASIDPASGAVSAAESRRSDQFGRVSVRQSDLRGQGAQLTLSLSPDVFRFRSRLSLYSSVAYTLQQSRREYRGFDGAAFGHPGEREWAPSMNDARHVVLLQAGISHRRTGTITMSGRMQSGLPFTPVVQGDVNGDGRGGDRAFIPDPSATADPVLAEQLRALLASGAPGARSCLEDNLGKVPERNACRGSWTQTLNLQWRPPMPRRWGGRFQPNIYFQNVLGGVDQLLNGDDLRGWGNSATPDPVLLVPRGFDGTRFRYDVNPRFGETRGSRTLARTPFRIAIDVTMNLSTNFDLQQLRRAVEPVPAAGGGWQRRSADSLAAFYLSRTSSIHKILLANSDSLFLSAAQVTALRQADSVYSARVRAVYTQLGEYLASRDGRATQAELDSARASEAEYQRIFWEQPEVADSIVTPAQRELMPMLRSMVATPKEDRPNSRYQFGYPVTFGESQAPSPVQRGGNLEVRRP